MDELFSLIKDAQTALSPIINKTPLNKATFHSGNFNLFLKMELLQQTGSYKLRGATNKIFALSEEEKANGIIAASAGNHAQGVANAAQKLGIDAIIVMPKSAPLAKIEATAKYGVKVMLEGDTFDEAYAFAKKYQKDNGRVFIECFNDDLVIAGQGTLGLEILEQCKNVDIVFVPIGGGGLASGVACAIKNAKPEVKVIGVEVDGLDSMNQSILAKQLVTLPSKSTLADGIAVRTPGDITFKYCSQYLDDIITVEEDEIAQAILVLIEKMKCVSEGAGAVSLAAVLSNKIDLTGKNVVAILSGGNIDVTLLSRIINRGLIKSGRKVTLGITLVDKPKQLYTMLKTISDLDANIVSISHERSAHNVKAGYAYIELELETTNTAHITHIIECLQTLNYKVQIEE